MKNITVQFDPCNNFKDSPSEVLYEACGWLPGWVLNQEYMELNCLNALMEQYCCYMGNTDGFEFHDGVLSFPEDPDFYPLIKITRGQETFYQYQYSLVCIVQENGDFIVTRMD